MTRRLKWTQKKGAGRSIRRILCLGVGLVAMCLVILAPASRADDANIRLERAAHEGAAEFAALAERFGRRSVDWYIAYLYRPQDIVFDATGAGQPEEFVELTDKEKAAFVEFVATVDTHLDGRYTQQDDEFDPEWDEEILDKWDRNGDGVLSEGDLAPRPTSRLAEKIRDILRQVPEGKQLYVGWPTDRLKPEGEIENEILDLQHQFKAEPSEKDQSLVRRLKTLLARRSEMLAPRVGRGARLFTQRCAGCHGRDGRGDGPASRFIGNDLSGAGMLASPRDFTLRRFKFQRRESGALPTDGDLFATIRRGIPGSAMPGWMELTDDQTWDLVDYVKRLVDEAYLSQFRAELHAQGDSEISLLDFVPPFLREDLVPPVKPVPDPPPESPELLTVGRHTYLLTQCFTCHGVQGRGDGARRFQADARGRKIEARNYRSVRLFKGGSTVREIYRTIANGIGGTPMPAHPDDIFVLSNTTPADFVVPVLLEGGGEDEFLEDEDEFFEDDEFGDEEEFDGEEPESRYEFQLAPGLTQAEVDEIKIYVSEFPSREKLGAMSEVEKETRGRELRWALSYYIKSLISTDLEDEDVE